MRARIWALGFAVTCAVALVGGGVVSRAQNEPAKKGQAAAMSPEMEAWMKLGNPGEAHKKLDRFVGKFDAKVKFWFAPGAPPEESTGVDEATWVLDGRFVQDHYQGMAMGKPFTGIGMTGYDNYAKKYIGSWTDTMTTTIQTFSGTMDASGKTLTMTSTITDPVTGKPKQVKGVTRVLDDRTHTYTGYDTGPDGKEFKSMEITYTRR